MARQTWGEIKAEAIRELRSRNDITTRVETWLRAAYLEVAYGYRFYELEKSAEFDLGVGASEVTFEQAEIADLKHVFSLRDSTNHRRVNKSHFRYIDRLDIHSGIPTLYCRFGSSLLFNAAPTGTNVEYKLRYRRQIADIDFSAEDAFSELPEEWDEVIRLKGVARGFAALFEPAMSLDKKNQAVELIATLPTDEVVESEDDDFGITPRS